MFYKARALLAMLTLSFLLSCASTNKESTGVYAVRPFVNLSNDPQLEFFGDSLAESIRNELARRDLKVVARSIALGFKGSDKDVWEIGKVLDVDQVLEGSVSNLGGGIHVTVQLVSTSDGSLLWSEQYDSALTDVLALRDEVSSAVVHTLMTNAGLTLSDVEFVGRIDEFVRLGVNKSIEFESVDIGRGGSLSATFIAPENAVIADLLRDADEAGFPDVDITSISELPSAGPRASRVKVIVERFNDQRAWRQKPD